MKNKSSCVALIALLLLITASSAFCLTYNVVEIPLPQYGVGLQTHSINEVGQVVGECHCYNGYGYSQAYIYENGVITLLTGLGGRSSAASAINDQGWAVGYADTGQSYYNGHYEEWFDIRQACIWQAGTITDLGTLGGYCSRATDVNNLGDIIGMSDTTAMGPYGFQISKPFIFTNGQMTDLNQLLPPASGWELDSAYAINDSRQIVGARKLNGVNRCFFFDLGNGTITTITVHRERISIITADSTTVGQ